MNFRIIGKLFEKKGLSAIAKILAIRGVAQEVR
jgi:hypothetical protein